MLSLNDRKWKEFSIADIFVIKSGKRLTTADMDSGNLPFIGATELNNGVTNWINTPNETLDHNVLGVNYNGSVAEAFYHPYSCVFSDDVKRLHLKNADDGKYILLFCSMLIRKQKVKYTYGYKFNGNRMARQKILLPITDDGSPDYVFMEQYIREREDRLKQKYIDFVNAELETPPVPLVEKTWGVFYLKDLFCIIQRGKRLVREHQQAGTMPYVSSTAMNNGIDGFISTERTTREFSNCLTIANSGSVGSSFYQPSKFIASDHITHLKNDSYTMYVYLFIATMTKRMSEKYNFNREINDYRISREKILLPTTDKGSPDYAYMTEYAKAIMFGKYKKYLEYAQK